MITHATVEVRGARSELAAFAARLEVLFAQGDCGDGIEEQLTDAALHYDIKVEGGVPFPPFALASREFPALEIAVEWVNAADGTRGAARIVRGTLVEQRITHEAPTADAGQALAICVDATGYLTLALSALRTGRDAYRGYVLTGRQDALFTMARDAAGDIELRTTQGAAEWSRGWSVPAGAEPAYGELDPPQPIEPREFRDLEQLARDFVARWMWFASGPREEIAIEIERYQRLGYEVSDANVRSSALHRIREHAITAGGSLRYSTLDHDSAWVAETLARCWACNE